MMMICGGIRSRIITKCHNITNYINIIKYAIIDSGLDFCRVMSAFSLILDRKPEIVI